MRSRQGKQSGIRIIANEDFRIRCEEKPKDKFGKKSSKEKGKSEIKQVRRKMGDVRGKKHRIQKSECRSQNTGARMKMAEDGGLRVSNGAPFASRE